MFKLRLKNFRGFLDEEFDFSRVNILIGENSAGKSSILKFLLALKQSLHSGNDRASNLTLSGTETDLGNYYETIYNHETDRNLEFSFELGQDFIQYLSKYFSEHKEKVNNSKTICKFKLTKHLQHHYEISTIIENDKIGTFEIIHHKEKQQAEQDIYTFENKPLCDIIFNSTYLNKKIELKNVEYEKQGFLTHIKFRTIKWKEVDISFDKIAEIYLFQIVSLSHIYISLQLAKLNYINPIVSNITERFYFNEDERQINSIKSIKDLIDTIEKRDENFKAELTTYLQNFGIADGFSIKKEGQTKELRIKLKGIESNIKDVGFGVALQFVTLAQALLSEKNKSVLTSKHVELGKILLIEQPEVHLHPSLQAKFIETLLQMGKNNVYFIETHSEHIVRMLQVLVKNKKFGLTTDDVSIHYFKKNGLNMEKTKHKINPETGKLMPAFPKGFYDISYNLAFQLID